MNYIMFSLFAALFNLKNSIESFNIIKYTKRIIFKLMDVVGIISEEAIKHCILSEYVLRWGQRANVRGT